MLGGVFPYEVVAVRFEGLQLSMSFDDVLALPEGLSQLLSDGRLLIADFRLILCTDFGL